MMLYYYRGSSPNFGDELNHFLLPAVFPSFFDDRENELFLGIGSVLSDQHPVNRVKIVFGSGYGGYGPPAVLDQSWKVYCVRGPRTADALGLSRSYVAGDAAILIKRYWKPSNAKKSYKLSYIPHWESLQNGDWRAVCKLADINFIDPRWPVDRVLEAISSTEVLISEAMHGAIVSDALRIPWIPILPFYRRHEAKWFDWGDALDLKFAHRKLAPSSVVETWAKLTNRGGMRLDRSLQHAPWLSNWADQALERKAAASMRKIALTEPMLSNDLAMERALDRLQTDVLRIRRDFPGNVR